VETQQVPLAVMVEQAFKSLPFQLQQELVYQGSMQVAVVQEQKQLVVLLVLVGQVEAVMEQLHMLMQQMVFQILAVVVALLVLVKAVVAVQV
jgi:hypothetical protein